MTKEEILKSKEKSIYIREIEKDQHITLQFSEVNSDVQLVDKTLFKNHFDKYNYFDTNRPQKIGQFFLYEKLMDGRYKSNVPHDHELFYPKLGLYLNSLPCDQTVELEWVDCRRTWEWQVKYEYKYEGKKYHHYMGEVETEIQRLPMWHDYLLIYGVWDSMPNWRQLRQAYERTWWFHRTTDELRNLQLERLLK
jgi:hypothetical protein